jgi:hypothetical protein
MPIFLMRRIKINMHLNGAEISPTNMIRNIISKYKSVRLITVKMAMRTSDQD